MATNNDDFFEMLAELNGERHESRRDIRRRTRGLPDENARQQLAETYLKFQHKHWPELVKAGVLPNRSAQLVEAMAEGFRTTFESGQWKAFVHEFRTPLWKWLGTAYLRYGDDNSNPRSLDQQLLNILGKAR